MKTPNATIATGTPPRYRRSVRESHLEYPRGGDDADESLAAHHRNQRRATARHDRGHLDDGVVRFHRRHVRRRLGQHFSTVLPPSLSATRSAIDSLSTPASDGSSWTYAGTSSRTTCDAGNIVTGIPAVSVTTSPGSRRVASNRTASSALESSATTGNSSAICSARTHQRYDAAGQKAQIHTDPWRRRDRAEPRSQRHLATPWPSSQVATGGATADQTSRRSTPKDAVKRPPPATESR